MTQSYEYYEVRACIETEGSIKSYASPDKYKFALNRVGASGHAFETYWSLYGCANWDGDYVAECIGDFDTRDDAMAVLKAILAPLQQIIDNCFPEQEGDDMDIARNMCDDIISRSSI